MYKIFVVLVYDLVYTN